MAKIIVKIDISDYDSAQDLNNHIAKYKDDYFPRPGFISIDVAYLETDPNDNSFKLFEFVRIEED